MRECATPGCQSIAYVTDSVRLPDTICAGCTAGRPPNRSQAGSDGIDGTCGD